MVSVVMTNRMLRGIRDRVEGTRAGATELHGLRPKTPPNVLLAEVLRLSRCNRSRTTVGDEPPGRRAT
jgi:hypothetical protein